MKSICALFAASAFAGTVALTSCQSVPEIRYQQIYDTNGNRYDSYLMYDKGTLSPVKTPLAKLLSKNQTGTPKPDGFREGYFFYQSEEARARGTGIGDTLNNAAWYILNFKPESEHASYAAQIGEYLRKNETGKADDLLAELRSTCFPNAKIVTIIEYHDENKRFVRSISDRLAGRSPSGKINTLYGPQRYYSENGLLRNEHFCIDGKIIGTVILYTPEGKIESVKEYE